MSFAALGLSPALLRATAALGYTEPTPIQAEAIPALLAGRDVLASAQTGSGKTAAFALPLLQHIERSGRTTPRRTLALVLVPTRELAAQVGEELRALARQLAEPVKVLIVYGGVSINPQMMALRGGAEVVVATPGRLLDLIERNALSLADVATLVLDEADRLLDAGFADELARLLTQLPAQRQSLLFSATFAPAVHALAQALLREPLRIDVPALRTADDLAATQQRSIQVDAPRRTQLLRHLIEQHRWERVLVFVATRYASEHVAGKLCGLGIAAAALHGEQSQGARNMALADFKAGNLQVLVATDLAARGLHVDQLPVVINFDLARAPETHTHRIGRTGRAGASGLAISFISTDSAAAEAHFRLIEKRQGQRVPREQVAGFEPSHVAPPQPGPGGIKGKGKSKKDKLREAAARRR